ncbi:hypothetical protein EOD08_14800, partial [Mesorhizobium sp. M6A.T.Ca.TU.002.02.2.1]
MTDDARPFDRALFLHEREITQDDQDHDPDDEGSALAIATATAKRQNKTALRATQGDRTDWKQHLVNALGYRNIPDAKLSFRTKQGRSKSIRAAAERRERRRELGVAIHYA